MLSLLIITLFLNAESYGQKLFKATYTNKEGEEQTQEFDKLEDALDDNNYWTHYPEENLYWFPLEVTITQTQDDNYYVNKQTLSPGILKSPDSGNMRTGVKRYILNLQNVSFPENAEINVKGYGIIIQNIILNSPLIFNIPSGPVLEIKGGTFNRKVSFVGTENKYYGILEISGGTFTNGQNDDCALSIENIYSVEVSGGDFRYQTSTSSNLDVSGPTAFKVVSNRNDIKITGGTFGPANPDANINGTGLLVEAFAGIMKISGGTFKGNPGAIKNITGKSIIDPQASFVDINGSVFTENYNSSYLLADGSGNPFGESSVGGFGQYLELSNEGKTLTFKYGLLPEPFGDNIIELKYLQQTPGKDWSKVETVVFDQSYTDNVLPTSCAFWFSNFENLKEIQNLDKLNTSQVTNMYGMFMNCSSLETIDISTFSTASLKKDQEGETVGIKYMFYGCKKLKSITLYNPETPSVHFTPNSNITSLSGIFSDCNVLETIDLSYFDIGTNITDMSQMFYNCNTITTLDLSKFNTNNVTDMSAMFYYCNNLTTILVDQNKWKTNDGTNTSAMFSGCINLIGNNGTQYDDSQTSGDYAHIDEGQDNPGYFTTGSYKIIYDLDGGEETGNPTSLPLSGATSDITLTKPTKEGYFFTGWSGTSATGLSGDNNTNVSIPKGSKENRKYTANWAQGKPYAVVTETEGTKKMTFYYGVKPENNSTQTVLTIYQDENFDSEIFNNWKQNRGDVIEVIFDESFKKCQLTTCSGLFAGFSSLTTITNIENFDASQVKDMNQMFSGCSALESMDFLKNIKTSNVTNMSKMFQNCSKLESIDFLNNINTSKVEDMSYMFNGCSALKRIDLNINTEKVTDMSEMFQECSSLISVNLDINTSNVKDMHCMFTDCSWLTDITFGNDFTTANVTDCGGMFYGCTNLTKPIDMSLFDLRLCEGYLGGGIFMNTGYTNIVLKEFNIPEGITSMHQWFQRCEKLETIDLRDVDISSVKDFSYMFAQCENLKTIIVDKDWKINNDAVCDGMFSRCFSLEGKYGTKYDEGKTDGQYARVDSDGAPGYLSDGIYTISYIHKDQNGETINITLDNNYPTKYTYDDNDITINKPTQMPGYSFKEWKYTISTDKDNILTGDQIIIPHNSVGNYEITITWDVESKIKIIPSTDFISFPTDWKKFCKKQETEAILTYSLAEGSGEPKNCIIIIETIEGSVNYETQNGEVHISTLPTPPGKYNCSAVFVGDEESTTPSDTIKFTLEITAARGLILQLYKNVIFVNNSSEKFETYQWYRYGEETDEKLKNGERQYFTEPTLKGSYWALLNGKIHACYMEDQPVIVKQAEVSISTYPNPAVEGEQFTIEINNFDPDTEYSLIISNSNGNIIKQLTVTKKQTTLSLPRGFYTGALMWSGNKQSFKIIVR
ncbi:MAG: BspA family leucine-rich repeat surface protein [Bacteroidales bacterium]|nr:BspA family leucine-rich repeat surface protein [Bacteroidales bacterium]